MIKVSAFTEQTLLGVVEKQIRENKPAITKQSFERLNSNGYTSQEAKEKIALVVLRHIYDVLNNGAEFDREQFEDDIKNIKCTRLM